MRRALAGLLFGWYALVPALDNLRAPIHQWDHFRAFDTAKECEEMMIDYVRKLPKDTAWFLQAERVRCIESSDPRLKG